MIRTFFLLLKFMCVPINKYKVVGRLNSHPIATVPLWKSTPASDGNKRTFDLSDHLLDYLGELADLNMVRQLDEFKESIFKHF